MVLGITGQTDQRGHNEGTDRPGRLTALAEGHSVRGKEGAAGWGSAAPGEASAFVRTWPPVASAIVCVEPRRPTQRSLETFPR